MGISLSAIKTGENAFRHKIFWLDKRRKYRGEPPACAWVSAIVRHYAKDTHSGHAVEPLDGITPLADSLPSPESQAEAAQLLRLLREIVAALPQIYRQVVETRLLDEHSTAETAALLGIS